MTLLNQKQLIDDYFTFLRMPSISADPAHAKDMIACCQWVADYLKTDGLDVEIWETPNYPAVFANYKKNDGPTLLIYGHYDVQPVDPVDEWDSQPFEPELRDGEVYARGAQDNKGQILYTMCAIRSLLEQESELPLNVKILIEGEEETKSIGLSQILESRREELQADYLVAPDFDVPALDQPAVTLGLRGMAAITVNLRGSTIDLHSGMAGGIVYNPNHALVELLAKLRDADGKVTLPGFYDQVTQIPDEELKALSLELDWDSYEKTFGTKTTGGEKGYTPGQSVRIRPTLEINGISGGYSGPGFKTVIPAQAMAKISCRLVLDQDPNCILDALKRFLKENCPPGITIDITDHGGGRAVRSSPHTPLAKALAKAYTDIIGKPCAFSLSGGSVPITAELSQISGATPAFCGYGLLTDQIHAPNEHFGLDRMELGFHTMVKLLRNLG